MHSRSTQEQIESLSYFDSFVDNIIDSETPLEFFRLHDFSTQILSQLMFSGFLIMGLSDGETDYFYGKLHEERMAIKPARVKPGKTVRRKLPKYKLSFDICFEQIFASCIEHHGDDWLRPQLLRGLQELRNLAIQNSHYFGPRPVSFELWSQDTLVAGEFGILCGSCYTSYSGFTKISGAGTIQLYALGSFLDEHQITLWDLGMPIRYKRALGAESYGRGEFIQMFRKARVANFS